MSQHMLDVLRTETVRVYMSLVKYDDDNPDDGGEPVEKVGCKWITPSNAFVHLRTRITNHSRSYFILLPLPRILTFIP